MQYQRISENFLEVPDTVSSDDVNQYTYIVLVEL